VKRLDSKKVENILALTPLQEGMLFHYLKDPQSENYFEQLSLEVSGEIDVEIFEQAWNFVVETNEMLRTVFRWEKLEKPVQISLKEHKCSVILYDLSDKEGGRDKTALEEIKNKDRHEAFDLHRVPFRVILCKLAEKQYEMIISNHHILYDGWSTGIILKEFFQAYRESGKGVMFSLPVKPALKEFVKWMRTQDTVTQEEYWKGYLKGFVPDPGRAVTRKRKKRKELKNAANYKFNFPGELKTKLDAFIKGHNITTASFLYSVWGVLLQNYHSGSDIIFDATVSGRSAGTAIKGIADMVGFFINTLPMRVQTFANETTADFLSRMYRMVQEWAEFENSSPLPVREILDKYHKENLFDSVVVIENYPLDSLTVRETAPLSIHSFSIVERTFYDLTVIITPLNGIEFNITFNNDLFDEIVISRLSNHLVLIVEEMVTYPDRALSEIDIWVGEERETFLALIRTSRETEPEEVEIDYTAPRDEVEEKLASIWSEILNVDRDVIGIENNFFDFGGHSLKASLLAAGIRRVFNVKVPLAEIFKWPTIRELAKYISGAKLEKQSSIEPVEKRAYYRCTSVQKRLYMLHRLDPHSIVYNGSSIMLLEGLPDKSRLEQSFKILVNRHESLRTSFHQQDDEPVQKVFETVDFELAYFNLNIETVGPVYPDNRLLPGEQPIMEDFIRPFDLSQAPLWRVGLVQTTGSRHVLIVDMHHIITDGTSVDILIREFVSLYRGEELPPLKIQYKDFAQWQYKGLTGGKLERQEKYWMNRLSGRLPLLDIPTDYPRPQIRGSGGDKAADRMEKESYRALKSMMRETGTTLFMMLLSAYNILLSKYSGQQDIIIGVPNAGRNHPGLDNIIGIFVETLVFRSRPREDRTFEEFLTEVKKEALEAFENRDYPLKELMNKLDTKPDFSRNPLFDTMLLVQNVDISGMEIEGLRFHTLKYNTGTSMVDLTLNALEESGTLVLELEYSTALFKRSTAEQITRHLIEILEKVMERPSIKLTDITLLDKRVTVKTHYSKNDFSNFEF
jgi:non-ribosomal peptide synthetase component F